MWSVGINGTLLLILVPAEPKGYGFDSISLGLIYFAPMTAVVVGELWGHFVCLLYRYSQPFHSY